MFIGHLSQLKWPMKLTYFAYEHIFIKTRSFPQKTRRLSPRCFFPISIKLVPIKPLGRQTLSICATPKGVFYASFPDRPIHSSGSDVQFLARHPFPIDSFSAATLVFDTALWGMSLFPTAFWHPPDTAPRLGLHDRTAGFVSGISFLRPDSLLVSLMFQLVQNQRNYRRW